MRSACERRISTSAAAPSAMELELAAVTVPPSRKAGFSVGIFSDIGLQRLLVLDDIDHRLAGLHSHRHNLRGEAAGANRLLRAQQRSRRVGVLLIAGKRVGSARNPRQKCPSGGLCRRRLPGRRETCGRARGRGPCDSRRGRDPADRARWSCFPCRPPRPLFALPASSRSWASMAAFIPEPHILFTVVAPAESCKPAPSAACRAGACPSPAGSTQPISTSSTDSGECRRAQPRREWLPRRVQERSRLSGRPETPPWASAPLRQSQLDHRSP